MTKASSEQLSQQPLTGKVALVTGAAGGLGSSICKALRDDGAEVLGVDIVGDSVFQADIGTDAGTQASVDETLRRFGRLDIVVPNAAVQHVAPLPDFATAEWDRVMDVVLKGPFMLIRAAWPALIRQPGGRVIAIASTSAVLAEPYKAAYVAAKHGVVGLVKVAAAEGGQYGLTANAVSPGLMMTGLIEHQLAEQARLRGRTEQEILDTWCAGQAVKRPVDTMEVAAVVAFLAGPRSSGITGVALPVDLGELACTE